MASNGLRTILVAIDQTIVEGLISGQSTNPTQFLFNHVLDGQHLLRPQLGSFLLAAVLVRKPLLVCKCQRGMARLAHGVLVLGKLLGLLLVAQVCDQLLGFDLVQKRIHVADTNIVGLLIDYVIPLSGYCLLLVDKLGLGDFGHLGFGLCKGERESVCFYTISKVVISNSDKGTAVHSSIQVRVLSQ